ncbi:transcriptional regulator [Paraburkholderia tropica]|uniref:transcriptional regulator n=1 Tax=Paraburkholderia tropica TaxID=92647 RepID=UPI0016163CD9|nr:YdaS family helix-turn-helix protein [Paraburkholderia tropica]MBB2981783.1 DNA-binding transcriptional regulator YdaS (Cro superfamily) [Paraburkholderia tropica]MBB6320553.1 DNA-binding transcriptional regulator YdaS (Cro superfamily) [Paraburkholderia tropica]
MNSTRPVNKALERAIAKFDSLAAMARALGLSGYQVIQEWRRQCRVPAEHCPQVERMTGEPCEELNPKVDWAYVRSAPGPSLKETAQKEGV